MSGMFGQGSDDEQFRDIAGNWGKLEATVGREAYEADVDMKKAAAESHRKHTELLEAQRQHGIAQGAADIEMSQTAMAFRHAQRELVNRFSILMYFVTVLIVLGGSAGVVYLWRWALGFV